MSEEVGSSQNQPCADGSLPVLKPGALPDDGCLASVSCAYLGLGLALRQIADRAPASQPEPLRDEFGWYASEGNTDDVVRDAVANERWEVARLAREALFRHRADGGVDIWGAEP